MLFCFHQVFKTQFPVLMVDEDDSALLVIDGDNDLLLHTVLDPLVGVRVLRGEELRAERGLADPGATKHHHPGIKLQ